MIFQRNRPLFPWDDRGSNWRKRERWGAKQRKPLSSFQWQTVKSRKSVSSFDSQWEKRAVSHTFRVSFIPRNRPNQLSFSRDKILRVKWQQEEDKTEQKVKTMWEQNKWHEWVQEEERHMKDRYELWKRECVWILFSLHTKLSNCKSEMSVCS